MAKPSENGSSKKLFCMLFSFIFNFRLGLVVSFSALRSNLLFSYRLSSTFFFIKVYSILIVESKVGGWVTGLRSPEDVELEIEEVENISGDPSIGPGTPSTPSAMTKSQTKT